MVPCLLVVPGREKARGGDQVKDSDHGHLTEVSSRTCTHINMSKSHTHVCCQGVVKVMNQTTLQGACKTEGADLIIKRCNVHVKIHIPTYCTQIFMFILLRSKIRRFRSYRTSYKWMLLHSAVNGPTLYHKVDSLPLCLHADGPIWRVDVGKGPTTTHDGQNIT